MSDASLPRVVQVELATFRFPDDSPLAGEVGVVNGYAVVHRAGVVVVDTGMGFGDASIDEAFRPRARRLPEALADEDLDVADVIAVVNSHLHFDHSGQNALFPGVPIHVQGSEWAMLTTPDYTVREWIEFPGARYERSTGDAEILAGVRVIATPGHTPGHQSVAVDTPDGVVVIAGQALYTAREWRGEPDRREGRTSAWDPGAYARSVARLRALDPVRVFFGHDREPWRR